MLRLRRSEERGAAEHGWLSARHTFSFAEYYDPAHKGFRVLRVINEDRVQGGKGFSPHPHQNMEIVTYVIQGALEHKDSMGNGSVIHAGDVQYMSAGSGVTHSEFNHSRDQIVHLLQIWIYPRENGLSPQYAQIRVEPHEKKSDWRLLVSPDGEKKSIAMRQDAKIFARILSPQAKTEYSLNQGRAAWIQMIRGELEVNSLKLQPGDGLAVEEEGTLRFCGGHEEAEFLLFDLP